MKRWKYAMVALTVAALAFALWTGMDHDSHQKALSKIESGEEQESHERREKSKAYVEARLKYEFDMLKDPVTGKIPAGIFEKERAFARLLPEKTEGDAARPLVLNTYIPAGPNNIGGRTRAVAYDV